jgi:signal transduction histidine kinase
VPDRTRRTDEFGELELALQQMAQRFEADNQRLQQLNESLKRLNEQQQRYFADITHELRNPLHTLLATLELLQLPNLPEAERQKQLATLQRQGQRLALLFEDLLTLQRAEADSNFLKLQPWNPNRLLQDLAAQYEPLAQAKGLAWHLHTEPLPTHLLADAARLEQVLVNLLSNALKYTDAGHIALVGRVQQGGIWLEVQDTGIGIAPEHLAHLTERFYRTDGARTRNLGGAGLGLAVVQKVLEAHGTHLQVQSEVGKGSSFGFRLG